MIPTLPCNCYRCKEMCFNPCVGTPIETQQIISAGLGKKLRYDIYDKSDGSEVRIVLPRRRFNCIFFDNGCKLHNIGLKPIMARAIDHNTTREEWNKINDETLESWNSDIGKQLVNLYRKTT